MLACHAVDAGAQEEDDPVGFESVDEDELPPEAAEGLPLVRGGPEFKFAYPFGVGAGGAIALFIADRLQLSARYAFVFARIPVEGTEGGSGHFASGLLGVSLLHGRGRRAVRLVVHEEQELTREKLYYTTGMAPTHHYLLVEGGLVTAPYKFGRCVAACGTELDEWGPGADFQGLIPAGGLRYIYYYKVDSELMTRATRYLLELAGHVYLPALNAPSGELYFNDKRVDGTRPGFLVELAFQFGSYLPGTVTLSGGLAPSHPDAQLGFMYGYYFD